MILEDMQGILSLVHSRFAETYWCQQSYRHNMAYLENAFCLRTDIQGHPVASTWGAILELALGLWCFFDILKCKKEIKNIER